MCDMCAKEGCHITTRCPVCSGRHVRYVSYVYGDHLRQANGRCIVHPSELERLDASNEEYTRYVVEVCPDCGWNFLTRRELHGHGGAPPRRRRAGQARSAGRLRTFVVFQTERGAIRSGDGRDQLSPPMPNHWPMGRDARRCCSSSGDGGRMYMPGTQTCVFIGQFLVQCPGTHT